jgi:exodeoxyribonuclease III
MHNASSSKGDELYIVSWNIAGLRAALTKMNEHAMNINLWLKKHKIDILCLQETKVSEKKLAEVISLLKISDEYEVVWHCHPEKAMNGVVTIVRREHYQYGDYLLLDSVAEEGRCVITHHFNISLFNAYVPNAMFPSRLTQKIHFLDCLHKKMQEERKNGRLIALVGDLNITMNEKDLYWKLRDVHFNNIMHKKIADADLQETIEKIRLQLHNLKKILDTKICKEVVKTKNGKAFSKWRILVKKAESTVQLGALFDSRELAEMAYNMNKMYVTKDEDLTKQVEEGQYLVRYESSLKLSEFCECLSKLVDIRLDASTQEKISDMFGTSSSSPCEDIWIQKLIQEDYMCDSFRFFYPKTSNRYTCWSRMTGMRKSNVGRRIDYALVDDCLRKNLIKGPDITDLRLGTSLGARSSNLKEKELGMTAEELNFQFQWRGTGLVYTPPQLSDHIPVSLLLSGVKNNGAHCADHQVFYRPLTATKPKLTDYFRKRGRQENICKLRKISDERKSCELALSEEEEPKLDPGYST